MLRSLDIELHLWPLPVEMANPIKFTDDHRELSYDLCMRTRDAKSLARLISKHGSVLLVIEK
jgi:hypothetical protein